jgi:hypothetical protein
MFFKKTFVHLRHIALHTTANPAQAVSQWQIGPFHKTLTFTIREQNPKLKVYEAAEAEAEGDIEILAEISYVHIQNSLKEFLLFLPHFTY